MKVRHLLFAPILLLLVQCGTMKGVKFHAATTASSVEIPQGITKVEVLNRTRPLKRNIIKAVATGSITYQNRPGVNATMTSFKNEIKHRKYFEIPNSFRTPKTVKTEQSENFPVSLNEFEVQEHYEGDYLLASLEIFQIYEKNSFVPERKMQLDENGNEYYIDIVRGTKILEATTGWRLYNSITGKIIDEFKNNHTHSFTVEGINQMNAREKMEAQVESAYNNIAKVLGAKYAERISPVKSFVGRNYYAKSKSCPDLKAARVFTKEDDWETAKTIWKDALQYTSDTKCLAKLHFNLGVYYEKEGDLNKAIEQLELSFSQNQKIAKGYLNVLKKVKQYGYPIF